MPTHERLDIVEPGSEITFGAGWSDPVEIEGRVVRTAGISAALTLHDVSRATQILVLSVEPVRYGEDPVLSVRYGDLVLAEVTVFGHQLVRAVVPRADAPVALELRTDGTEANDAVHVAAITAHRAFGEIVLDQERLRLGEHWHPLEIYGGRAFRWATDEVGLELLSGFAGTGLEFDVEVGPGADAAGMTLSIRAAGVEIGAATVSGNQRVRVDLGTCRPPVTLTLVATGGGTEPGADGRILHYRVFDIRPVRNQ